MTCKHTWNYTFDGVRPNELHDDITGRCEHCGAVRRLGNYRHATTLDEALQMLNAWAEAIADDDDENGFDGYHHAVQCMRDGADPAEVPWAKVVGWDPERVLLAWCDDPMSWDPAMQFGIFPRDGVPALRPKRI